MGVEELSLIRFGVINFYSLIMNRPLYPPISVLCIMVKSIIESETNPDKVKLERVKEIYEKTNKNVNTKLSYVELMTFKNLERGINKPIEIGNREFSNAELYNYLSEIRWELSGMITGIVKKYALDIPMYDLASGGMKIGFGMEQSNVKENAI